MFMKERPKWPMSWTNQQMQSEANKAFGYLGQYTPTAGEQLVLAKLNKIAEEFSNLGTMFTIGGRDFSKHRDLLQALTALKTDVTKYVAEPKASAVNVAITNAVEKHEGYQDSGQLDISKERIKGKLQKIRGILESPMAVSIPAPATPTQTQITQAQTAEPSAQLPATSPKTRFDYKKYIFPVAIATTVGFFVTMGLKKWFK